MFYLSLQFRIALAYIVLIVITMAVVAIYLMGVMQDSYEDDLERSLHVNALLFAKSVQEIRGSQGDFTRLLDSIEETEELIEYRVTLTDKAGSVVGDTWTHSSDWGGQLAYEEILSAVNNNVGVSRRISTITNSDILYVAVPVFDDENVLVAVVRLGASLDSINTYMNKIVLTVSVGALVILILSVLVAIILARRVAQTLDSVTEGARALAAGDLDYRIGVLGQDTVHVARAFNRMGANMKSLISTLSSEQEKLSIVLDTLEDGVILVDAGRNVLLMNTSAAQIIKLGEVGSVGRPLIEVTREYEIQRIVENCLLLGQVQYSELSLEDNYRAFTAIATPMHLDSYTGCLITLHDVTELVRVDTTRKEFVSNVSHELRTPLTAVRMIAETLQEGALADKQLAEDYVARIIAQIDNMTQLVTDLLALSLLDRRDSILDIQSNPLGDIIAELQQDFSSPLKAKDIVLQGIDLNTLGDVECDRQKMKQVFSNLLDNAIKFTELHGVIKIDGYRDDQFVVVKVRDTGAGIARDDIPHIFERFYKVDRSRGYEGTGLGLAIVRHIVQSHGGSISVESKIDEGSEFTITLPAVFTD